MAKSSSKPKFEKTRERGVYYRGPGQYLVRLRRKGHSPTRTFPTFEEAVTWKRQQAGAIAGEAYVDTTLLKRTTLDDLLARYLKEVTPDKKGATAEKYVIAMWRQQEWASWPVVSVRKAQIIEWRDQRKKEGKAPSTINNALNLLSAVYTVAAGEWDGFEELSNPLHDVRRATPNEAREVNLEPEQEAALLAACRKGPPYLIWCTLIAISTAMRASEIRRLEWQHVHLAESYVHLPKTKNGTKRDVPLVMPEALAVFKTLAALPRREDGWLFGDPELPSDAGGFTRHMLAQAFRDARLIAVAALEEEAGRATDPGRRKELKEMAKVLKGLTFHDLRHVSTTRLAAVHRDALDLAKTTGHKTISVLARYYNEKILDRVRRLQRAFRELAEREARIAAEEAAEAAKGGRATATVVPLKRKPEKRKAEKIKPKAAAIAARSR